MFYLLHGTDTEKARHKLHELVAGMKAKKPDASHICLTEETFSHAVLDELISSHGLFAAKAIIESDNVCKNKEAKEAVAERARDIAESDNVFIFLEGELDAKTLKKLEKHAAKVQEFSRTSTAPKKDFNIFSLTDAFARRDRKELWVLYMKAKRKNVADEEIHGIIFWQVKALLLAAQSKSATEAGLNPYVYQKSVSSLKNFSIEELKQISQKLVTLYHRARRGIGEFDTALEKFILEV